MALNGLDIVYLLCAVVLAALGGNAFLKSILGVAEHLRLPKSIVATTLAAFATSSPELTVSTVAALSGKPEIGLGDALGSNVVNVALIFGLALLFGAVQTSRSEFSRDYRFALLVPIVTLLFITDGQLASWEAWILITSFGLWLFMLWREAKAFHDAPQDDVAPAEKMLKPWVTLLMGVLGLAALIAAGRLFVVGATGIASAFAVNSYVIGVVLIAIGTSLPELVTVILSRIRGQDDVGVGTIIGSNLFNGLAIVGVAGAIHRISAPLSVVSITLGCGVLALLLILPAHDGQIRRWRALPLLALYSLSIWLSFLV